MMTPQARNFRTRLRIYRAVMTKQQRSATRRRRPRKVLFPKTIERVYARQLTTLFGELTTYCIQQLTPFLQHYTPIHTDSIDTELQEIFNNIDLWIAFQYGDTLIDSGRLGHILETIVEGMFGKNSVFFEKEIKVMAGVPLEVPQEWFPEVKSMWEQENYRLIKSMQSSYVTQLNTTVMNGLQNGIEFEELVSQIGKITDGLQGYKSRRLARDQIGKLQSYISKGQALSIGAEGYIWMTVYDERLRGNPTGKYPRSIPSHYMMDNLVCSWTDPTVYSIDNGITWLKKTGKMVMSHVGMEIMCRCTAATIFTDMLYEIDRELGDNI